jgi:hypothetical protein
MKSLEVQNILKSVGEGTQDQPIKFIRPIGTIICPKWKKKYWYIARSGYWSQRPIGVSVYQITDRSMIYAHQPQIYSFGAS